ncbi:cellulose biosynthesis regulator YedQ [Pantoea sp. Mb-10]|uniref:cellulose biosynthesis regulator diguanylate cyclase DgcQ n=1 Tax=unclassified Pantoea TaxID=2630326 RepID=UPI001E52F052|nr:MULTISPECIES: cellulose biosynthesis regulator diguanylate cyclase DgcQ [unclassified Pantoea]MCE0489559.1 cellulose biosynthesis regulator YedQ [Pantoea sp. Mb-10]MCE0502087.1 cellulose biosynthesis regulator YedQ [Pantoea sp. Pb-8]
MPISPLSAIRANPFLRVHLCFLAVFIFSACITAYEARELKNNYEARQAAQLAEVQKNLDSAFQESLDELVYYEKMLTYALHHPLDHNRTREIFARFDTLRQQPTWQLQLTTLRSVPLNGVSDDWLTRDPLLVRSEARLHQELSAALEFSYILQFSDPNQAFHSRFWYLSRAGFYISSRPPDSPQTLEKSYATMVQRDYFRTQAPDNPHHARQRWTTAYQGEFNEGLMITVSTPIVSDDYWFGVLSMDFTQQRIRQLLANARMQLLPGRLVMVDRSLHEIARLESEDAHALSPQQRTWLLQQVARQPSGIMHLGSQFISWKKLAHVDAYLINVQSLKQALSEESGRVLLFLFAMWLLFTLLLWVAHRVIIRAVARMDALSSRLRWRANYDGLTQLLNRNAFFDRFVMLAKQHQQQQRPLSVIQLDIDHFKRVNDTWGHHAGDQALVQVAGVLKHTVRDHDVAGRIGGEEFCLVLPDTPLKEAEAVAERIRARLAAKTLLVNASTTFTVTLSAGVSSSEEQGEYHPERLQAAADRRLYLAKNRGRNCVCAQG